MLQKKTLVQKDPRRTETVLKRVYHLIPFLLIGAISLVAFRSFFSRGSIMIGDFVPPSTWYVWSGEHSTLNLDYYGGTFNLSLAEFPIDYFVNILSSALGPEVAYRIWFIFIPILSSIGIVVFLKYTFPNSRFGTIEYSFAALIYSFNPWVIDEGILPGHEPYLILAYSTAPFFFLFAFRYFKGQKLADAIYASIILAALGSAQYYWFFFLFSFFVVALLVSMSCYCVGLTIKSLMTRFASGLLIYVLAFIISSYWLLPFAWAQISNTVSATNPSSSVTLSGYASPINTIRLLGFWWQPFNYSIYHTPNVILNTIYFVFSFTIVALIIPPLLFKTLCPDKMVRRLGLISVPLFILLAGGTQFLGFGYEEIVSKLPFMNDPTLFLGILVFMYALLVPCTIRGLRELRSSKETNKIAVRILKSKGTPSIILALLLIALSISIWPVWTGNFNQAYSPVLQPSNYNDAYSWLAAHSDGYRTLWLPATGVYDEFTWNQQNGSYVTVSDPARWQSQSPVLNDPFGSITSPSTSIFILQIERMLENNLTNNIGQMLSIAATKYIAVRTDQVPISISFQILNECMKQKDLKLVWNEGSIYIFQNMDSLNLEHVAYSKMILYGGFNTLMQLPQLGYNLSTMATFFPEQMNSKDLTNLLNDPSTQILVPNGSRLDLTASMVPPLYWINLQSYVSASWTYDEYIGTGTGDVLYNNFAISSIGNNSISVPISYAGNVSILVRFLGNPSSLFAAIDGRIMTPMIENTGWPGFRWIDYNAQITSASSNLNVSVSSDIRYAINSVIIIPTLELLEIEESQLLLENRIVYLIEAPSLYPVNGATLSNSYGLSFGLPQPWTVSFSNLTSVAGSASSLLLEQGNYTLGVLAYLNKGDNSGNLSLNLYVARNSTWLSFPFQMKNSSALPQIVHVNLPSGVYPFQIAGSNITLSSILLTRGLLFASSNQTRQMLLTNGTCGFACFNGSIDENDSLILSYSYSPLWHVNAGAYSGTPVLVNGFGIGFLSSSGERVTTFQVSFVPETYLLTGTAITCATIIALLAMLFVLRMRRK